MSPAMVARLETRLWDINDIVKLIEEWEAVQQALQVKNYTTFHLDNR